MTLVPAQPAALAKFFDEAATVIELHETAEEAERERDSCRAAEQAAQIEYEKARKTLNEARDNFLLTAGLVGMSSLPTGPERPVFADSLAYILHQLAIVAKRPPTGDVKKDT